MLTRRERLDALWLYLSPIGTALGAGYLYGRGWYLTGAIAWSVLTLALIWKAWYFTGLPPRKNNGRM